MKVTVSITRQELDDYIRYGAVLRENPCIGCPDKPGCCGCPRQSAWAKKIDALPVKSYQYSDATVIRDYVEAFHDYADAVRTFENAKECLDKARNTADMFREKFEVV